MSNHYLLLVTKALSKVPTVSVLTSGNITRREDQARLIYNNKDKKHIGAYGRFNPETDLLIPVTFARDIGALTAFAFDVENLCEEDEGDASDNVVEVEGRHAHIFSMYISRSIVDDRNIIEACGYPSCNTRQERRIFSSVVIRTWDELTEEGNTPL